jgi:hypothetical protein
VFCYARVGDFFSLNCLATYELAKWTSPFHVKFRWMWLCKMNPFKSSHFIYWSLQHLCGSSLIFGSVMWSNFIGCVTASLVCPTVVTGELAHQSCMNPSQGIYGGTNWKVSLFIYSQILYCFHQITNTFSEMRHFHLAPLRTAQWINWLRFLLHSLQSFHLTCSLPASW